MDDKIKALFTDKELAAIKAEALAAEREAQKKQAKEQLLEGFRREARQQIDPTEEIRTVTIDLAEYADRVMLDGVVYFHGQTYQLPKRVFDVVNEVMRRAQEHEHEISGKKRAQFKARPSVTLSPGMENIPARSLVGA